MKNKEFEEPRKRNPLKVKLSKWEEEEARMDIELELKEQETRYRELLKNEIQNYSIGK